MSKLTSKEQEELRKIVNASLGKIKESELFLSLVTPNFEKDPTAVLQLGLAILLDKPIYVVADQTARLPENLKRIAKRWEVGDLSTREGMERAVKVALSDDIEAVRGKRENP